MPSRATKGISKILLAHFTYYKNVLYTGRYSIIPCLLSVCFDDAMHGRYAYASFYINKGIRHSLFRWDFRQGSYNCCWKSLLLSLCLHKMKHNSHASQIKTKKTKVMGWWGSTRCLHVCAEWCNFICYNHDNWFCLRVGSYMRLTYGSSWGGNALSQVAILS